MKDFNDKVIVITGAASGMGRAFALAFARRGSLLALCDFDETGLQETLKLIVQKSLIDGLKLALKMLLNGMHNEKFQ